MNFQLKLVYDWIVFSILKKSKAMWFSTSLRKPEVKMNNMVSEVVDTQLHLGLMFDSTLSWASQVSNMCKKCLAIFICLIVKTCFE